MQILYILARVNYWNMPLQELPFFSNRRWKCILYFFKKNHWSGWKISVLGMWLPFTACFRIISFKSMWRSPRYSVKELLLKSFANSQGNACAGVFFLRKLQIFQNFQGHFFSGHLQTTTSECSLLNFMIFRKGIFLKQQQL